MRRLLPSVARTLAWLFLVTLTASRVLEAAEPEGPPQARKKTLRQELADRGVTLNLFLNDQVQSVAKGGLETNGSGRNAGSMDAFLTLDLGKLGALRDADLLIHAQSNWGAGVNARTGALYEVNDDADGDLGLHIAQAWFRQHFLDRKVSLTVGFLDYQTIVERNAYANSEDKHFLNQTLDNNPLVPLGIGLGAAVTLKPADGYTLTLGVVDAQSRLYKPGFSTTFHDESWFLTYAEQGLSWRPRSSRGSLPGNLRIGFVYDPRPRPRFIPRNAEYTDADRDLVGYANVDQLVFRESVADEQGLGVFGRFGYRDPETQRMSRFWSAGLSYTGLIPGRDRDVLAAAFSLTRSSHVYRSRVNDDVDNETLFELYYAIQVRSWLTVTPDVQYIDNPGAGGENGHTVVVGVRVRVSL